MNLLHIFLNCDLLTYVSSILLYNMPKMTERQHMCFLSQLFGFVITALRISKKLIYLEPNQYWLYWTRDVMPVCPSVCLSHS